MKLRARRHLFLAIPVIPDFLKLIWLFGTTLYIVAKANCNSSLAIKMSYCISVLQGSVYYWLNSEVQLVNNINFKDAHGPGNLSERMSFAQGIIVFFQGNLFFNLKYFKEIQSGLSML